MSWQIDNVVCSPHSEPSQKKKSRLSNFFAGDILYGRVLEHGDKLSNDIASTHWHLRIEKTGLRVKVRLSILSVYSKN